MSNISIKLPGHAERILINLEMKFELKEMSKFTLDTYQSTNFI